MFSTPDCCNADPVPTPSKATPKMKVIRLWTDMHCLAHIHSLPIPWKRKDLKKESVDEVGGGEHGQDGRGKRGQGDGGPMDKVVGQHG
jgi:hypothetical protein